MDRNFRGAANAGLVFVMLLEGTGRNCKLILAGMGISTGNGWKMMTMVLPVATSTCASTPHQLLGATSPKKKKKVTGCYYKLVLLVLDSLLY